MSQRTIFKSSMKAVGGLLAMMFLGAIAVWYAEGGTDQECARQHQVIARVEHSGEPIVVQWSLGQDQGDREQREEFSRLAQVGCGNQIHVSAIGSGRLRCILFLDGNEWGNSGWKERRCSVTQSVP